MRAPAFALELRSGGRDHVLHGEAELLLQLLQRRRRTEGLHADARALGPDVPIPPEPARLLHGYPSRDVGGNYAVPIRRRLLLEQLPRRHADDAGPHARGAELLVRLDAQGHEQLGAAGVRSRVVSMPSWELFEQQPLSYRNGVIPPDVTARVSVEQASGFGWDRYVGPEGARIGMETFGASAPLQELQKKFGFTVEHVVAAARAQLERKGVGSHAS